MLGGLLRYKRDLCWGIEVFKASNNGPSLFNFSQAFDRRPVLVLESFLFDLREAFNPKLEETVPLSVIYVAILLSEVAEELDTLLDLYPPPLLAPLKVGGGVLALALLVVARENRVSHLVGHLLQRLHFLALLLCLVHLHKHLLLGLIPILGKKVQSCLVHVHVGDETLLCVDHCI